MLSIDIVMAKPVAKFLQGVLELINLEERHSHELRMQQLGIISNSALRDELAQQLLLDRFLAPVEAAQHRIHHAAQHAQYLAEAFLQYRQDHGASHEEAEAIAGQLRFLAICLTKSESLHDLKKIYEATTLFIDKVSCFQHYKRDYSIGRGIRQGILNRLNDCIADENNFQRRVALIEQAPRLLSEQHSV